MPEKNEKMIEVPESMGQLDAASLLGDFAGDLLDSEEIKPRIDEGDEEAHGEAEDDENDLEAAGDDESEEYDDESEGEEEHEGGEADDETDSYTVRVGGEELEVTWDELIAGYSRTADYTRKTQAVATERKAFEQEQASVRQEREEYGKRLDILKQTLAANQPEEPTDPAQWIEWKKGQEQLQAVEAEQGRLHQRLQEEWLAEQKVEVQHEAKLLRDAIPEWSDEAKMETERKAMVSYAMGLGYSEEDLQGLTDHRAVLVLRRAMLYDSLQEGRKTVKRRVAKTPTMKPGRPKAKKSSRRKGIETRAERLSKSGHKDDAAALLESIMDADDL